jgi:hypothetical protein
MVEKEPTREQWQRLYTVMRRVREIEPWQWMEETDVFGVKNPDSDEMGFVSVMGLLGEHFAVALYMGAEGLYGFWDLQDSDTHPALEHLIEIPQLQASFENRDFLDKRDRDVIKRLGLSFRGKNEWPLFRSYRAGYFPWFLDVKEVQFMTHALEQVVDVALRFREDDTLLDTGDGENYLIRISRKEGEGLVWEDCMMHMPPPELFRIRFDIDAEAFDTLKSLPKAKKELEIDLFLLPAMVGGKGPRPYCPYVMLVVDALTGMVLGEETLLADPSMETMWGSIPGHVVQHLLRLGFRPREVRVQSELLVHLLTPITRDLGITLTAAFDLQNIAAARESMIKYFSK